MLHMNYFNTSEMMDTEYMGNKYTPVIKPTVVSKHYTKLVVTKWEVSSGYVVGCFTFKAEDGTEHNAYYVNFNEVWKEPYTPQLGDVFVGILLWVHSLNEWTVSKENLTHLKSLLLAGECLTEESLLSMVTSWLDNTHDCDDMENKQNIVTMLTLPIK